MPSPLTLLQSVSEFPLRAILRIASGIGLVIIGVIGLILPVMPGFIFLIPGLVILAEYFPPVRRLVDWATAKLERVKNS
ncbi:MAG: PGPGW domain-containing protein [Acidobacteriota bacterium]|jgi:uncharacterized membrane protein YbaN (DUF454 family)